MRQRRRRCEKGFRPYSSALCTARALDSDVAAAGESSVSVCVCLGEFRQKPAPAAAVRPSGSRRAINGTLSALEGQDWGRNDDDGDDEQDEAGDHQSTSEKRMGKKRREP